MFGEAKFGTAELAGAIVPGGELAAAADPALIAALAAALLAALRRRRFRRLTS